MKKLISGLLITAMLCTMVSCGGKKSDTPADKVADSSAEANADAPAEEATEAPTSSAEAGSQLSDLEPLAVAETGDAYLAIADSAFKKQYWGNDDIDSNNLGYNAGIAHITGNGDYTVSVTTDSNGYRFATTGNKDDASAVPTGLSFMAVMIRDGETAFPGVVITVNSIVVNGNEISMTSKPYTSSDDGKETRANIFNEWQTKPPKDGRCAEGPIYADPANDVLADYGSAYSAQSIDRSVFDAGWNKVEVNFTVSGIAE